MQTLQHIKTAIFDVQFLFHALKRLNDSHTLTNLFYACFNGLKLVCKSYVDSKIRCWKWIWVPVNILRFGKLGISASDDKQLEKISIQNVIISISVYIRNAHFLYELYIHAVSILYALYMRSIWFVRCLYM